MISAFWADATEDPYMMNALVQEERSKRDERDYDVQVRQQCSMPDESYLYLYLRYWRMLEEVSKEWKCIYTHEKSHTPAYSDTESTPILTRALFI